MISCWFEAGTQFCADAIEATDITKNSFHIRTLKIEPQRCRDQPRLSQVRQIASIALPGNAARTQRGPVMHITNVVGRDAPGADLPHDLSGVANAKIKEIVLGRISAVNVIDRTPSDMLPVEIQIGA